MADETSDVFETILKQELMALEGAQMQNPETGANILNTNNENTFIDKYTNRIFGAPFQLLDSVDKRFSSVNSHVGNEYLRHFILNGPILHIKPGMPQYTGGASSLNLGGLIGNLVYDTSQLPKEEDRNAFKSLIENLLKGTVFGSGSKLQKRMYGFRETYYQYNQHVNYMCRCMAAYLGINDTSYYAFDNTRYYPYSDTPGARSKIYPCGIFLGTNNGRKGKKSATMFATFQDIKWENYRMLEGSRTLTPEEYLGALASNGTVWGATATALLTGKLFSGRTIKNIGLTALSNMVGTYKQEQENKTNAELDAILNPSNVTTTSTDGEITLDDQTTAATMYDKVCSVQFMVEPISYEETLTNQTGDSQIAATITGATSAVGSELSFIANSKVDTGIIGSLTNFLGDTVTSAAEYVGGIVEPIAGGFASNLINGAVGSLKGQNMIYPKIYNSSEYTNSYQFIVNLSTPYGDVYNYYVNEVVPLCHLLALAAPRMVTSNATSSPYLVQVYMPGMITVQLGMITNMTISKNPNINRVSVNGFPLDIKVTFTVEELYHSLAISPANDPASFLYNETLNDYMANLAGLMPSNGTYALARSATFKSMEQYFASGDIMQDLYNDAATQFEDLVNPYVINGS